MTTRPWRVELANPAGDWDYVTSFAYQDRALDELRDLQKLWPDYEYRVANYAQHYCETDPDYGVDPASGDAS